MNMIAIIWTLTALIPYTPCMSGPYMGFQYASSEHNCQLCPLYQSNNNTKQSRISRFCIAFHISASTTKKCSASMAHLHLLVTKPGMHIFFQTFRELKLTLSNWQTNNGKNTKATSEARHFVFFFSQSASQVCLDIKRVSSHNHSGHAGPPLPCTFLTLAHMRF